jgi:hypothetical protein
MPFVPSNTSVTVRRASALHVKAAMAESRMPSQICLLIEGAALKKRSFLSCGNCVAGWEFEMNDPRFTIPSVFCLSRQYASWRILEY